MSSGDKLERIIGRFERGALTSMEFSNEVRSHLDENSTDKDRVLSALTNHASQRVRELARELRTYLRNAELSCDLDFVRRTSPLQPGVQLVLFGGYDYYATSGCPWWLNGRDRYKATFLAFVQPSAKAVPVAYVELHEAIDLPGHEGRFALLRGGYTDQSAAWGTEGTVTVHIVDALPGDLATFYAADPFPWLGAIETHAEYRVVPRTVEIVQEIGRVLDELAGLRDAQSVGYAALRLRRLLAEAPQLRPTVLQALVKKSQLWVGAAAVAIRPLLCELGMPALRALRECLADEGQKSFRRGLVARAIGSFGPDAKEAVADLESLLSGEVDQRVPAAIAIWQITGRASELAPIVVEALRAPYTDAEDAIECLREMGPDAAAVAPMLMDLLKDETHPSLRARAAETLGGMGLAAAPAINALIEASGDAHKQVRASALGALRELRALARFGELILMTFDRAIYPPAPADAN